MSADPVLRELWRIKDEIAAQYDYDVRALCRALREEQRKGARKVVSLNPKDRAKATS